MSTKYLVHCTAPASVSFKHGDWRGEPRWESNAVDALLTEGKVVHSTTNIWKSPDPRPPNLYDMRLDWMQESIQITYGVRHEIYTGNYPAEAAPKYRVVQYQDGPTTANKEAFLKYDRISPGSIVATCSFKAHGYVQKLENIIGKDNVVWTYGPTVPKVFYEHNSFEQPNMLWAYRNFCSYAKNDPNRMKQLFGFVANTLQADPTMKLVMLIQPQNTQEAAEIAKDCRSFFFSFGFTRELAPYKDRVEVYTAIDWVQVLAIMSKTKLIISPAEPLGGAPFEAASYGIPTILEPTINPFVEHDSSPMFPEVLTAGKGLTPQFLNQLARLQVDREFYRKHGDAYRRFVGSNATYSTYVAKLEAIKKERGWLT